MMRGGRLLLWALVYLQSPFAYDAKKHPVAPLSVLAMVVKDQRQLLAKGLEPGAQQNATVADMMMSVALMPSVLVRTPAKAWLGAKRPGAEKPLQAGELFGELVADAVDLCTAKTGWWSSVEKRHLLVVASMLCAISAMMLAFGRRGYAQALYSSMLLIGLLLFAYLTAKNKLTPTKQVAVAFVCCIFEGREARANAAVSAAETAAMMTEFEARGGKEKGGDAKAAPKPKGGKKKSKTN